MNRLLLLATLTAASLAMAKPITRPVAYSAGSTTLEGVLVYDDASKALRPGLVLVPNWMGVSPANVKQAQDIAGQKYVVLVADVYGKETRPKSPDEAGKAAGALRADRKLLRARMGKALETLLAQAKTAPLDPSRLGGAVHSFTDPDAKAAGQAAFDARASKRAFQMMDELFAEVFGKP